MKQNIQAHHVSVSDLIPHSIGTFVRLVFIGTFVVQSLLLVYSI